MEQSMRRKHMSVPLVAAALVGCAGIDPGGLPEPSRTRDAFGTSVRQAQFRQTIDPEAARRAPSHAGLDGPAAVSAWRRYQESFTSPPPSFEVMGIGSVGR
jgi:hypothetical protein